MIHANATALEASLAAVEGRWERVVCLGDIVDYGPDPNEVTERVKALDPIIIRGNHDKAVAGPAGLKGFQIPCAKLTPQQGRRITVMQLRASGLYLTNASRAGNRG